ncbi:MAG: DUF2235 domain-containing protein [Candidatus Thiodiazotropha sp. (ex Cardiolucina cf. quadrata)]|nr:DUF2235 domain-containing protein [Candidatus Thiodiazotropha sp. (ex Cardiolucina cf. quadrata)]
MKRIIICADGTWNIRDQLDKKTGRRHPTNVTKIARAIKPKAGDGTSQIVYYHEGVGTNGPLDKVTGGAFGKGMEENIRNMYRFIVYNYEPGDELYLFGFSRGAFTVRSLAGFMNLIGLIEKDDDYYVPEMYLCYEKSKGPDSAEWEKAFRNVENVRPCPPIKLVGVWDTVGALGAPGVIGQIFNRKKYQYHDIELNPNIENAIHAISIDERRKPFKPSIWKRPLSWQGEVQQAWFAGVHSNVGGSYSPDGLANEALHWVVEKSEALGLECDHDYLAHFRPCFNSVLNDSMTIPYRVMGPFERQIGNHVNDGEVLHQSVLDRMHLAKCDYAPSNLKAYTENRLDIPVVNTTRIDRDEPCPDL